MIKLDLDIHQDIINMVQMNKVQKYKELKQIISEKRKKLKIRIEDYIIIYLPELVKTQ